MIMGYDYDRPRRARSARSRRSAGPTTTSGTPSGRTRAQSRRPRSSSACRTTAVPGRPSTSKLAREEHLGHEVRGVDDGRLRRRLATTRPSTARTTTRSRASPGPPTDARTARQVRLREAVAPALLRRRERAQGQVRPRQPLRPARRRDLGARLRRHAGPELYAAIKAKFITDTVPPAIRAASISPRARLAER